MKVCFKCGQEKELSEFYPHKQMGDGYLGKCKDCTKSDTKKRTENLLLNPEFVEKERSRGREKYYRLYQKNKRPLFKLTKAESTKKYQLAFPEKRKAHIMAQRIKSPIKGLEKHHWSYKEEHWMDIIWLSRKDHAKAHRFIIYDQERMMYRRYDTNELLDTKESHLQFITLCITQKQD